MKYSVCVMAAGMGSRTQLNYNKVFYKLNEEETVVDRGLCLFLEDEDWLEIVIFSALREKE